MPASIVGGVINYANNAADLGGVGAAILSRGFNAVFGTPIYEPQLTGSISRDYAAGVSQTEIITRAVLGSNPVTGPSVIAYDLSVAFSEGRYGDVAEGLGGLGAAALVGGVVVGGVVRGGGVTNSAGPLRFSQVTASAKFSDEGSLAGFRISDVANDLRTGAMQPSQVPVEFVVQDGTRLIVNTRSSLALQRAGVPQSQWTLIDRSTVPEVQARITQRLIDNKLSTSGTPTLRITGAGKNVSNLE